MVPCDVKPSVVRMSNCCWWEDAGLSGHGLGDGSDSSRDLVPFMNQTFVYWSNGSRMVFHGSVSEAREFFGFP
jgi:hypothetical protein